jgi:hypothetical protein
MSPPWRREYWRAWKSLCQWVLRDAVSIGGLESHYANEGILLFRCNSAVLQNTDKKKQSFMVSEKSDLFYYSTFLCLIRCTATQRWIRILCCSIVALQLWDEYTYAFQFWTWNLSFVYQKKKKENCIIVSTLSSHCLLLFSIKTDQHYTYMSLLLLISILASVIFIQRHQHYTYISQYALSTQNSALSCGYYSDQFSVQRPPFRDINITHAYHTISQYALVVKTCICMYMYT